MRLSTSILFLGCVGMLAGGCGADTGARPAFNDDPNPPPDTIKTSIQRVWSSKSVDFLGSIGPRGEQFAFTSWDSGNLEIRSVESGTTRQVIGNPSPYMKGFALQPVFSPTGDRLAFSWHDTEADRWSLAVTDTAGAEEIDILRKTDHVPYLLGWSPDESRLYARKNVGWGSVIYSVSVRDGSVQRRDSLTFRPENPTLSPNGRYLAVGRPESWSSTDADIRIIDLRTAQAVAEISDSESQVPLDWSSDGRYLLYLTDSSGSPEARRMPMAQGRPDGPATLVRGGFSNVSPIGFDRRGRFFYGLSVGTRSLFQTRFDSTGTEVVAPIERVTEDATRMAWGGTWSPDGKLYAYSFLPTRSGPGRPEVRLYSSPDGRTTVVRLARALNYGRPRAWMSNDKIVVSAEDSAHSSGLWTINVRDGSTDFHFSWPDEEHSGGTERGPWTVSPSKELVAWVQLKDGGSPGQTTASVRLSSYSNSDAESSSLRTLRSFTVPGEIGRPVLEMNFGPHGKWIYSWDQTVDSVRLRRTPVSRSEPSPETILSLAEGARPDGLEVGPAGEMLWYSQQQDLGTETAKDVRRIMAVDLTTGRAEPVGVNGVNLRSVSVGPEGRKLIFARGLPKQELWVLTGALPE